MIKYHKSHKEARYRKTYSRIILQNNSDLGNIKTEYKIIVFNMFKNKRRYSKCDVRTNDKTTRYFPKQNKTQMEVQEKIIIEIRNAMDRLNNMW